MVLKGVCRDASTFLAAGLRARVPARARAGPRPPEHYGCKVGGRLGELTWTPHDGDSRCEGWAPDVTSLCLSVRALGSHFLQFLEVLQGRGCEGASSKPPGTFISPGRPSQVSPVPRVVPWGLEGCGWGPMAIRLKPHAGSALGRGSRQGGQRCGGVGGMSLTLTWRGAQKHLSWGSWSQEGSVSLTGRALQGGGLWWKGSVEALHDVSQLHLPHKVPVPSQDQASSGLAEFLSRSGPSCPSP